MIKMNFQSHFSLKQFQALAELFNNSRVFQPEVEAKTMADLFSCRLKAPLIVRNARLLGFIMNELSEQLLVTSIWQTVADQNKCFVSIKGNPITRNTLSSAKYSAVKFDTVQNRSIIQAYIQILKNVK